MSLAAGVYAFNATQAQYVTLLQEFDILLGFFFSYKVCLQAPVTAQTPLLADADQVDRKGFCICLGPEQQSAISCRSHALLA